MERKNFIKSILPILLLPLLVLTKSTKKHGIGFEVFMGESMESAIRDQIPYYDEIGEIRNNPIAVKNAVILWPTLTIHDYYDEHDYTPTRDEEFLRDEQGNLLKIVRTDIIDFMHKDKMKYDSSEHILYCEVEILI